MSTTAYSVTITVTIETEDQDLGANHVERIMADAVCREHESDFRITSLSSFCNSITHSTPEQACLVCVDRNDECDGTCDWCDQAATSWAHGQHYCADCLEAE
jgi:hypothetical protein